MNSRNKVWLLTIVLWIVTLVVFPFFYSGATGNEIFTQGDLILAFAIFVIIGVGRILNSKFFIALNYVWGIMTLAWILVANSSRLISKTRMEIVDAVYPGVPFNIDELWILTLLAVTGIAVIYFLLKNLRTDSMILSDTGKTKKTLVTLISVAIPVLWCVTLNLMD